MGEAQQGWLSANDEELVVAWLAQAGDGELPDGVGEDRLMPVVGGVARKGISVAEVRESNTEKKGVYGVLVSSLLIDNERLGEYRTVVALEKSGQTIGAISRVALVEEESEGLVVKYPLIFASGHAGWLEYSLVGSESCLLRTGWRSYLTDLRVGYEPIKPLSLQGETDTSLYDWVVGLCNCAKKGEGFEGLDVMYTSTLDELLLLVYANLGDRKLPIPLWYAQEFINGPTKARFVPVERGEDFERVLADIRTGTNKVEKELERVADENWKRVVMAREALRRLETGGESEMSPNIIVADDEAEEREGLSGGRQWPYQAMACTAHEAVTAVSMLSGGYSLESTALVLGVLSTLWLGVFSVQERLEMRRSGKQKRKRGVD